MRSSFYRYKDRVLDLRRMGKSYGEILNLLRVKIPKSTLSLWCRNISLPETQQRRIDEIARVAGSRGRAQALIVNRKNRLRYLNSLYKDNKYLLKKIKDKDTAKIALAMLFLGEGSKSSRGAVVFGNSSPEIIQLYLQLLRYCYPLDGLKFCCKVQCRADQNIPELEKFWSFITNIPMAQFRKALVDPRTLGKPTINKDYKGVCRVDYYSAHIYNELLMICRVFGNKGPMV